MLGKRQFYRRQKHKPRDERGQQSKASDATLVILKFNCRLEACDTFPKTYT